MVSLKLSDESESSGNTRRDSYYLPEFAFDDVAVVPELISWSYGEVTTPRIAVCTLFVAHVPGHSYLLVGIFPSRGRKKGNQSLGGGGKQGAGTSARVMSDYATTSYV